MMAVGGGSTRGLPRGRIKVVERDRKARSREIEAVLRRRAEGASKERIARELELPAAKVERVLDERRAAGDARALTEEQVERLLAGRVKRAATKAKAEATAAAVMAGPATLGEILRAPAPSPAVAPRPPRPPAKVLRTPTLAAFKDEAARDWYVAAVHEQGCRSASPAHRGLLHLVDLYRECPTFYPTYVVRESEAPASLASTDREFPRNVAPRSTHTSPGALCVEG